MANYSLSNAWENARQRLALLEQYSRSNYTQTLIRLGVMRATPIWCAVPRVTD